MKPRVLVCHVTKTKIDCLVSGVQWSLVLYPGVHVDFVTFRHVLTPKEGCQHVFYCHHKKQLNAGFTERFIAQQEVITLAAFITWTV